MLDTTRLQPPQPGVTRDAVAGSTATSGFAELVCSDPAWVDAEFDAIMTANFGAVPPCRPPVPQQPGSAGPRRPGRVARSVDPGEELLGGTEGKWLGGRRERSPPPVGGPVSVNRERTAKGR
jgi:hypothetical protein